MGFYAEIKLYLFTIFSRKIMSVFGKVFQINHYRGLTFKLWDRQYLPIKRHQLKCTAQKLTSQTKLTWS